ncbi:DNA N-6-adenine-methyltransferase [Novosphingobium sp.]|uniref:DNA N-6-adenine-methyltransferase n=1 Tax=Novosphingobium sp. TaxID=1874826 RepID=UPI003BAC9EF8
MWDEIAAARREAGLSQQRLADQIGSSREAIARLEAGSGSVSLVLRAMSAIPIRMRDVARGATIVDQVVNARNRRKWSSEKLASLAQIDARTVKAVEQGDGTLASLNTMLRCLAPHSTRQPIAKIYWDYDRRKMAHADCRFTPSDFLTAIEDVFGPIDLDPCWHPQSKVVASRTVSLPDCGLASEWSGLLVYVNPPFGDLASWIGKANREWQRGGITKLLLLLPAARLDIREFFDRTARSATTLILRERLRFSRIDERGYPSPFALALACFGCSPTEIADFCRRYPSLIILPSHAA